MKKFILVAICIFFSLPVFAGAIDYTYTPQLFYQTQDNQESKHTVFFYKLQVY